MGIRANKEVLRRLETPIKRLREKVERERTDRAVRRQALREYKTESEIMDAYGWGQITDDERRELLDGLEGDRIYVEEKPTVSSEALMVLEDFASRLRREIDSFQFDLLPTKEQDRILREREERLEKEKKRRQRKRICKTHNEKLPYCRQTTGYDCCKEYCACSCKYGD